MKYYILDDEIGVVKALESIIKNRLNGEVVGYETNPVEALDEIFRIRPEILLVDFLMTELDGVSVAEKVRRQLPQTDIIMITKVSDESMISQAYMAGVEFLIRKPLNIIEIESVLKKLEEHRRMNEIVSNIKGLFEQNTGLRYESPTKNGRESEAICLENVRYLLTMLGMNGEKGTADILKICEHLLEYGNNYSADEIKLIAQECDESVKNIEQRIRRAIKKGLSNAANAGIDDYSSDIFQIYAGYVFDFTSLKDEMSFQKGLTQTGGRVNIGKFMDGLIFYHETCIGRR